MGRSFLRSSSSVIATSILEQILLVLRAGLRIRIGDKEEGCGAHDYILWRGRVQSARQE